MDNLIQHINTSSGQTFHPHRQDSPTTFLSSLLRLLSPSFPHSSLTTTYQMSETICKHCGLAYGMTTLEQQVLLQVPITQEPHTSLQDIIQQHSTHHTIQSYKCIGCQTSTEGLRSDYHIASGRYILIILQRDGRSRSTHAVHPTLTGLKLNKTNPHTYSLRAILRHHGTTFDSGHCTAITQTAGTWYIHDDARYTAISGPQLHAQLLGTEQAFLYELDLTPQTKQQLSPCNRPFPLGLDTLNRATAQQ